MSEIEERITKIETELEHIKEDNKDTKTEIKTINTINADFNIKMDRLSIALDNNVKSTQELTRYMQEQQNKGNKAFGKIGWLLIGGIISGVLTLVFKLIK